mgnify:CR=1 FL=1
MATVAVTLATLAIGMAVFLLLGLVIVADKEALLFSSCSAHNSFRVPRRVPTVSVRFGQTRFSYL